MEPSPILCFPLLHGSPVIITSHVSPLYKTPSLRSAFKPNKFKSKFPFTNRSNTPNQSIVNLFSCRTKMAASMSILLKRAAAPAPTILSKLSNPIRSASVSPLVSRSFNTNSQVTTYDQDESSVPVGRGTADMSPSRRRDLGSPFFSGSCYLCYLFFPHF